MTTPVEATGASTPERAAPGPRRVARALAVVGGTVAAVVVWVVAKYLADAELRAQQPGSSALTDIGPHHVIFSALLWSLLGWGLLALLERFVARARTVWMWLAIVGVVLSFASPLLSPNMTSGTRIALSLMHVAVAVVVIPVFLRTSPRS